MPSWWYVSNGARNGPVSNDELSRLFGTGALNGNSLLWKPGMRGWEPAVKIADLKSLLNSLPPELPAKAEPKSLIRVVRGSSYADRLRAYKLFVNGVQVGTIARNSSVDIPVPSGPLTLEARIDWGRSRPINIQALPGQTITIEVSNNWGALLSFWAISFGYRSYLKLTKTAAT
jgi:hypothetical protein